MLFNFYTTIFVNGVLQIAAAYGKEVCIYEPTPLLNQSSNHVSIAMIFCKMTLKVFCKKLKFCVIYVLN